MSAMSAISLTAFLLICLTVCVRGQRVAACPADGAMRLDKCLTTLEQLSVMTFLPARCLRVQEAWKCARNMVRGCMYTDLNILKVLASHTDLVSLFSSQSISLCLRQ